jgi:hypothetical protein
VNIYRKSQRTRPFGRSRSRLENNNKMNVVDIQRNASDGLKWLKTDSNGRHV